MGLLQHGGVILCSV